jgi:hypothetical protein
MPEAFIVAEISKNWEDGKEIVPGTGLLSQQFEVIINYNHKRGYRLLTFQINRLMTDDRAMNESIVAVFEKVKITPRGGNIGHQLTGG